MLKGGATRKDWIQSDKASFLKSRFSSRPAFHSKFKSTWESFNGILILIYHISIVYQEINLIPKEHTPHLPRGFLISTPRKIRPFHSP